MNDELKPCPFCGSKGVIIPIYDTWRGEYRGYIVCSMCGARTREYADYEVDDAINAWNRRTNER